MSGARLEPFAAGCCGRLSLGAPLRRLACFGLIGGVAACGSTSPAPPITPEAAPASAPLARVSFSSRGGQGSLQLGDRVPLFDRVGFSAPSAIIYDPAHDVYWVSNLNGEGPKGKGFISRLHPEGELTILNFIDAAQPGVVLDAPRGLAVSDDTLFVADVSTIRKFKADSGEAQGTIDIPGAVYLSDLAVAVDGSLYATDVGSDPSVAALPDTGADAVYRISPTGQVSTVAKRPDLGGPFAILTNETGLWIACTGTDDLLLLIPTESGEPAADKGRLALPGGAPRGLTGMPDGTFLISSAGAGAVYRGYRDGPFEPVITGLESPADLGYDTRRKRVLIPLLTGHSLAIFALPPFEIKPPTPP